MEDSIPIAVPAGYAPVYALGFAGSDGNLVKVAEAERLPVAAAAPAPPALVGETSPSIQAGPFEAVPDRIVSVTLGGTWQGTARLLRSTDAGVTRHALQVAGLPWAVFTAAGCEQAWL